jgi:hypothetical protein
MGLIPCVGLWLAESPEWLGYGWLSHQMAESSDGWVMAG